MKKESFVAKVKSLTSEAASTGVAVDEIKETVWNCFDKLKRNSHKASFQNGGTTRPSGSELNKGVFNWMKRNLTFFKCYAVIVAIACICYCLKEVVESEFSVSEMKRQFQEEQCLIGSTDVFTEIVRPLNNCSICSGMTRVTEVTFITQAEFREKYAYTSIPLLVKGAAKHWTATKVYNFDYFKDLYTQTPGAFEAVEKNCQFFHYKTSFLNLEEVFNMTDARAKMDDGQDTWYIGWCDTESPNEKELKKHYERPYYLPDTAPNEVPGTDWIFMGYPGEGAQIHIDMVSAPSWQAMVRGTKTWMLYPSVECEHVCSPLNVTIEAGDILTVDTNRWFHSTYIHPGSISISVGSEY